MVQRCTALGSAADVRLQGWHRCGQHDSERAAAHLSCSVVVQHSSCLPPAPTNCLSSSQMSQRCGGCWLGANWVPQVMQIKGVRLSAEAQAHQARVRCTTKQTLCSAPRRCTGAFHTAIVSCLHPLQVQSHHAPPCDIFVNEQPPVSRSGFDLVFREYWADDHVSSVVNHRAVPLNRGWPTMYQSELVTGADWASD